MGVRGEIDKSGWHLIKPSRKEAKYYQMNLSFMEMEVIRSRSCLFTFFAFERDSSRQSIVRSLSFTHCTREAACEEHIGLNHRLLPATLRAYYQYWKSAAQ